MRTVITGNQLDSKVSQANLEAELHKSYREGRNFLVTRLDMPRQLDVRLL